MQSEVIPRSFYGNKVSFFVRIATNWNHLSDDQVKVPTFQDYEQLTAIASII